MNSAGFTGGNWYVKADSVGAIEVCTDSMEYLSVRIASDDENCTKGPITKANAHLISAAPDMYEALNQLLDSELSAMSLEGQIVVRDALSKASGGE